jgi:hypothetical protein
MKADKSITPAYNAKLFLQKQTDSIHSAQMLQKVSQIAQYWLK